MDEKGKKGALEDLTNEELIKILHQQLENKEALKIELSSVQESSANLVPPHLPLITPIVQSRQGRRGIHCDEADAKTS
jgi:hypothetical protein